MKKHLLMVLGLSICVGAVAQKKNYAVKQNTLQLEQNQVDKSIAGFYQSSNNKPTASQTIRGSRAVSKKKFTSSRNAFGLIVSETNCLNADPTTNTVAFTHRISEDWSPSGVNNGFIQTTFTSNNGITWDSILLNQDQTNLSRYPSATLFNPSGNTSPSGLFSVVSGPITQGSVGWFGNYFASGQLNKTNINVKTDLNASGTVTAQHFARINMQATDTKVIVTGALMADPSGTTAAAQKYRGVSINYGTYASNNFTWAVDSIIPLMKLDPSDGQKNVYTSVSTTWSKDGTLGYIVFTGVDSAAVGDQLSYQPVVYKTTNSGTNWTKMPLGNFSSLPAIAPKLILSNGGSKKAFYSHGSGFATCVDANGNLHIVCAVTSASSDAPDSLGYAWTRGDFISYIYDTYTTATGWDAMLIDSLLCVTATTQSPFTAAGSNPAYVSIDARIQVSMTPDRTKLFYVWIDSDPTQLNGENALPDIKARGFNINTGGLTDTKSFPTDNYDFFMFASRTTLVNGSTYTIPCTSSNSRNTTNDGLLAFDHFYFTGVEFNENDFVVGIEEASAKGKVIISQNYPNPFSKETFLTISLKESASISLEVFNAIGQKVISQKPEELAAGNHILKIDGINLTAGMYFYTIKADNVSITRKMIVK